MPATALVLYVISLMVVFVLRSVLQYRRTGSTGFRGLSGRPGSLTWCGGVLFALAVVLGLTAPLLQLLGVLDALPGLDNVAVQIAGLALAVAGLGTALATQHVMGESWRIGVEAAETTALVTVGLFSRVRNPFFTAIVTLGFGLTLMAANPLALAGLAALVLAVEIQVRALEEPYLLATHGPHYRDYAARVGRFLPGLGRMGAEAGSRMRADQGT